MIVPKNALIRIQEGRQTLILRSGPICRYEPGRCYQLKTSRDRPAKLLITITDKRQVEAGTIDLRDARKLGYRTTKDFWMRFNLGSSEMIWLLGFEIGDHSDSDRLPAARFGPSGDYVSTSSRALRGVGSEVSKHLQAKYSTEAEEGHTMARNGRYGDYIAKVQGLISEIQKFNTEPRLADSLRSTERQLATLERKLLRDAV